MFSLRTILPALALALSFVSAQQQAFQVDCDATDAANAPSTPLDEWVNSLLTVLHTNAKFAFEQVLVGFAGTEEGYDVLESIWEHTANGGSGETWSLLVPSDDAFTKSGLAAPYSSLDAATLYSIFTYHALPVNLASAVGPVFETLFPLQSGAGSAIIAQKNGDTLSITSPLTATAKLITLDEGSNSNSLSGLQLYPVDTVITPPQSLPATLATFATTTSTSAKKSGLALYAAALNQTKTLNTLTAFGTGGSKGLTIFAPVDEAFAGSMTSNSPATWTKVLAGHYSSVQTLYSSGFNNATAKIYMSNGNAISFKTNSSGTFAISSDGYSSAKILRSDILLQGGGVLHIVDTLLSATALSTNGTTDPTKAGLGGLSVGAATQTQVCASIIGMLVAAVGFFSLV